MYIGGGYISYLRGIIYGLKFFVHLGLFVILGVNLKPCFAQQYTRFGIADGLSGDEVTAICKDTNYYWIGTTDGLCRFDGTKFKVFRKTGNQQNTMSSNNIETLMFDSKGRLWLGYKTKGVDVFYPSEARFVSLSSLVKEGLPHRVTAIYEDSRQHIWLGTWEEGVFELIPEGNLFEIRQYLQGSIVSSILEKPKGTLWFGTYYGGSIYRSENNSWCTFGEKTTITGLVSEGKYPNNSYIYYSTWDNGVKKVEIKDKQSSFEIQETDYSHTEPGTSKLAISQDKSLIYGSWGTGLSKIITKGDKMSTVNILPQYKHSYIDGLYIDSANNYWLGTYGNGLIKYNPSKPIVKQIELNHPIQSPISVIYNLSDTEILIGTREQGSFIHNFKTGQTYPYSLSKRMKTNAYLLTALLADQLLLLGDDNFGMVYSTEGSISRSAEKILFNNDQFGKVSAIYRDGNQFWFGTKQSGLFSSKYNPTLESFEPLQQSDLIGRDEITGIIPNSSNKLWIASHNGLFLFNTDKKEVENYGEGINEAVYCIEKSTRENKLWVGTSSGIFYVDTNSGEVKSILSPNILPPGAVKTLKLDGSDNLWFTIGKLVFCYKTGEDKFMEINTAQSINSPIISSEIISCNQSEYLLLGSTEGITSVDIHAIYNTTDDKRFVLSDFGVDLKIVEVGDTVYRTVPLFHTAEYLSQLTLPYKCKWLSFYFSEIGENIFHNRYQYRIKGFSQEWTSFEMDKPLVISQLPGGNYQLEVRKYTGITSGKSPVWTMNISVIPPFWQTVWFIVFVIILSLVLIVSGGLFFFRAYKKRISLRLSAIKREKEIQLLKEKENFFVSLSHDILTPFMLILSPVKDLLNDPDMSKENIERAKVIYKNADFLSDMFSTILDFKQVESRNKELNVSVFDLIPLLKALVNSFDYLAKSKNIALNLNTKCRSLNIKTDSVKLERILYNLINNALKYTPIGGNVDLNLKRTEQEFTIEVIDTGQGIKVENKERIFEKFYQEHRSENANKNDFGIGLYIVKNFISLINGQLVVNSEKDKGTSIVIHLPSDIICESFIEKPLLESTLNKIKETEGVQKPIVLIVEDNNDLRNYLNEKLSENFHIVTAADGYEALALSGEILPEVIISDLMMPGMDGLSLCKRIKENALLSDIFFILFTAKNSPDDQATSYKQGVDVFIRKPIDVDMLQNQIVNIVNTRRKQEKQLMQKLMLPSEELNGATPKDAFNREIIKVVNDNLTDSDFSPEILAEKMNLSKTVLHRKFKEIMDDTPGQFIKTLRLKKAELLLRTQDFTVSEIAYLCGFNHPHYFIKCFKEMYLDTPKNYAMKFKKATENN